MQSKMGNFGSSIGLKTAEKTFAAIDKLKIPESTHNLTQTIQNIAHPTGPIEFRVQIDLSDNIVHLAETFFVLMIGILIIGFILILGCWRVTSTNGSAETARQNGLSTKQTV